MATLYQLTGEYLDLLELAEDPGVDPEVFSDTLEGIAGEIEIKADGYAKIMATLSGQVETIKKETDRLQARRKALENNIERMKISLENAMRLTGKTKFKTDLFSFSIQKNPPSVNILCDTKDLPVRFLTFKAPEPNKKAIIEALKAGEELDWAELKQGDSLRIK
jgi:hypothetical protein